MRLRALLIAQMLALASLGCGEQVLAPADPPSEPRYVYASDCASVDSALRVAEATNQALDMGGRACTVALQIRANPNFAAGTNQARFVKIQNCGGGLTSPDARPILSMAPGVSGYFVGITDCLLLGNGIAKVLVDYSRMHEARFRDVWAFCGATDTAYVGTGPAHFNKWDGGLIGGGCHTGIKATAPDGPTSGPNSNSVLGVRFNGVGVGILIGAHVQNWTVALSNGFETCRETCLDLAGSRLFVLAGNRFEYGPVGITLRAGSDGWIEPQYWSSFAQRILFAGADAASWAIAAQPNSQAPEAP